MKKMQSRKRLSVFTLSAGMTILVSMAAWGQLIDRTLAPNNANEGIAKSFEQEVGAERGDIMTPNSSLFIIARDPARAVRRGRQIFQRKFSRFQGQGPRDEDGVGDIKVDLAIGAGLADACATCHGRPRGSAGFGGDVVTRPDSRDAPHLFGLGFKEMLADEITAELRRIRSAAIQKAHLTRREVTERLVGKGIDYGKITAHPDGTVDTSQVDGVNGDLRVRPFFLQGETISIREFVVGAFQAEMGLQPIDPDLAAAQAGARVVMPSGMVLDGSQDTIEAAFNKDATTDEDQDGVFNEIPLSIVDFMEFYLLNYFKPGLHFQNSETKTGRKNFKAMECAECHIPDLVIDHDRRVADVETVFDPVRGISYNRMFATATTLFREMDDGSGFPTIKEPLREKFVVRNIFTDFKRHDLGPNFHEINYDGTIQKEFLTMALWGVGSTAPYGHDGRSINLREVILRHGGEAQAARDRFVRAGLIAQEQVIAFLNSVVLFPPDDTPSNLDPGDVNTPGFPQFGHGSINLGALFNDPTDPE